MTQKLKEAELICDEVIGLEEDEAITYIHCMYFSCRVVEREHEIFGVTMDYDTHRINLIIKNKIVVEAYVG